MFDCAKKTKLLMEQTNSKDIRSILRVNGILHSSCAEVNRGCRYHILRTIAELFKLASDRNWFYDKLQTCLDKR